MKLFPLRIPVGSKISALWVVVLHNKNAIVDCGCLNA